MGVSVSTGYLSPLPKIWSLSRYEQCGPSFGWLLTSSLFLVSGALWLVRFEPLFLCDIRSRYHLHTHYYGFICHLTPTLILGFPLNLGHLLTLSLDARLPQLLHWLPVSFLLEKPPIFTIMVWLHFIIKSGLCAIIFFGHLPTNTAETCYG